MKRLRWGITGELLVMRNDALARIKVACDSYGTIKTNVAKKKNVGMLCAKQAMLRKPLCRQR